MGGGSSTTKNKGEGDEPLSRHDNGRKPPIIRKQEPDQPEQTLPYLQNTKSNAQNNEKHTPTPEERRRNKERFHRVLGIVRKETKALDTFNDKAFNIRKRQLATFVSESVRRDQQEAEQRLREELSENATRRTLEDDLSEGRKMLFSMIGYELSSDDEDEQEEEEHDCNRPRTTDSMLSGCLEGKPLALKSNDNSNCSSENVSRCNSKSTDGGNIPDMPSNRFDYNVFEDNDNDYSTHQMSNELDENSRQFDDFEEEMGKNEVDGGDDDDSAEGSFNVYGDTDDDLELRLSSGNAFSEGIDVGNNSNENGEEEQEEEEYDEEEDIEAVGGYEDDHYGKTDDDLNLKEDDYRPSGHTTAAQHDNEEWNLSFDYVPRRSSLLRNQQVALKKQKEHKLHSIMRQESLQERQARASLKLEKRKQLAEAQKRHASSCDAATSRRDIDSLTTYTEPNTTQGKLSVDKGTFEAKKNVKKEYKAYDQLRKESVANRHGRQRDILLRRLEERRRELGLSEGSAGGDGAS